jgi:beta-galactosidase
VEPDRATIRADGRDLSFITVRVVDRNGELAPRANDRIRFSIQGSGEIVATDNGDPTSFVPFPSHEREAFNGLALVIVRAKAGADWAHRRHRLGRGVEGGRRDRQCGRGPLTRCAPS